MKHVCILISGYPRDNARIFQRQAKSLYNCGFKISFITNDEGEDECVNGINFYCTPYWKSRIKILFFAYFQFINKAIKLDADVYFIHSPELLPLTLKLKFLGKKVVYDAHEDLPRHIVDKEWLPWILRRPLSFMTSIFFNFIFSRLDGLVSPHPHVVERYKNLNKNVVLITNFPISTIIQGFGLDNYLERENIICYSGTAYFHSNQVPILSAIDSIDNVIYYIAGTIPDKLYSEMMGHRAFAKVNFIGLIDYDKLVYFYRNSKIGLVILDYRKNWGGKVGTFAVNKMFEYMEAGLPIICSDYSLWMEVIDKYNCGIYVKPGDVYEINKAIEYLLDNPLIAYQMGQNGKQAVFEEYNWKFEESKLNNLFLNIVANNLNYA
jgi:glycosyltransferase involved in cell wall biosynthesis